MSISAASVLFVLQKFKEMKDKIKAIRVFEVDDKDAKLIAISRFEVETKFLEIELEYQEPGSSGTTKVSAHHVFRSDAPDVVKINGVDATDDQVDFDIDLHLLRADIEYRVQFTLNGARHEIFMLASIDWFTA